MSGVIFGIVLFAVLLFSLFIDQGVDKRTLMWYNCFIN